MTKQLLFCVALLAGLGSAQPFLESPVPLPAKFDGVITIFPDSHNTIQARRYWLVPSTVRIHRYPQNGDLAFGLVHSGVSRFDPDGISALLNITIEPYVDAKTLQDAKDLITQQAKVEGASTPPTFSFISPTSTSARLLVAGQYAEWGGPNAIVVAGGTVEAGIPFQIKLSNSQDVRALTQTGGPKAALFGAEFRMKFNGLGSPCEVHLHATFTETYQHMLAHVKASGWFGLVNADLKTEWQSLTQQPWVQLTEKGCSDQQVQTYHIAQIFDDLINAVNNRTGLFAKQLKANGLPDAPGGGGIFGWSVNAGGGFESYTDTTDFNIDLVLQDKQEKEIVYGLNFPAGGKEMEPYVKNLSDSNKPFATSDDFLAQKNQHMACRAANVNSLKSLLSSGTINQSLYDQLISNAITKGCYVDYTTSAQSTPSGSISLLSGRTPSALKSSISELLGKKPAAESAGSKVPLSDLLRFSLSK
jgi:hypothetical protein